MVLRPPPFLASLVCAALLGACATARTGAGPGVDPTLLVGSWSNAAQFAAAPADMKVANPGAAESWLDLQTVTFTRTAPGPDGSPTLSVVWQGERSSRTETWAFLRADGQTLLKVSGDTQSGLGGTGCALTISNVAKGAWNAQTDPERCRIETAVGPVAVETRLTVMPTGILFETIARSESGEVVFRRPGGAPYDLRRVP